MQGSTWSPYTKTARYGCFGGNNCSTFTVFSTLFLDQTPKLMQSRPRISMVVMVVVTVVMLVILLRCNFFYWWNTVVLAQALAQFAGLRTLNLIIWDPKVQTCGFRLLCTRDTRRSRCCGGTAGYAATQKRQHSDRPRAESDLAGRILRHRQGTRSVL